jgi:hypothetical protein
LVNTLHIFWETKRNLKRWQMQEFLMKRQLSRFGLPAARSGIPTGRHHWTHTARGGRRGSRTPPPTTHQRRRSRDPAFHHHWRSSWPEPCAASAGGGAEGHVAAIAPCHRTGGRVPPPLPPLEIHVGGESFEP